MRKSERRITGKKRGRSATNFDLVIGRRLRAHRLSHQMSQTDLARKLGISFQQLQKYERGENRISVSRLKEISEALEVPIAAWFRGDEPTGASSNELDAVEFMANTRAIRLLKSFSEIGDAKVQNLVVDLCERLAKQ